MQSFWWHPLRRELVLSSTTNRLLREGTLLNFVSALSALQRQYITNVLSDTMDRFYYCLLLRLGFTVYLHNVLLLLLLLPLLPSLLTTTITTTTTTNIRQCVRYYYAQFTTAKQTKSFLQTVTLVWSSSSSSRALLDAGKTQQNTIIK